MKMVNTSMNSFGQPRAVKRKFTVTWTKKMQSQLGNLCKHVKSCWGPDAVKAADRMKNVTEACDSVVKPLSKDGSIREREGFVLTPTAHQN